MSLGGKFKDKRAHRRILHNVGFSITGKRFYILLKPSNSKGSALLGVVKNVSGTSSNCVGVGNSGLRSVDRGGLARCHEGRLNCMFRVCGLVKGLGIGRGVRIKTCLSSGTLSVSSLLRALKLCRRHCGLPGRLSNNRRRHISVNHTVMGGPSVLLYSRPAKTLSCGASGRVLGLVRRIGRGCNGAVVVMARGRTVGGVTSRIVGLHSNTIHRGSVGAGGMSTRSLR